MVVRLLALIVVFVSPEIVCATLLVEVETAQLSPSPNPQLGSLEVFVKSDAATAAQLIAHQIRLTIEPSGAGVSFTNVNGPISHPYVFPTSAPAGSVQQNGSLL